MKRSELASTSYLCFSRLRDPIAHLGWVYVDTIYCSSSTLFYDRFIDRFGFVYYHVAEGPVIIEV